VRALHGAGHAAPQHITFGPSLAYVASGRLDLYVERTINLWDIAAGALMAK
jgi:3'-phosphoadenosine 5'-phosphosulfate (PAPS) 3'-phosphatase